MKLPKLAEKDKLLPIYVVTVEVVMQDGGEEIGRLLKERLAEYFRRSGEK